MAEVNEMQFQSDVASRALSAVKGRKKMKEFNENTILLPNSDCGICRSLGKQASNFYLGFCICLTY